MNILFGEPQEHGLNYCSVFLKELAGEVPRNITTIETNGTVTEADKILASSNPALFYHVGHGSYYSFTVECRTAYINSITGERLSNFKDKIVHLLSCETGMRLGSALVNRGAKAYLGYNDVFYYGICDETKPDPAPHTPSDNYQDFYSFIDCDVEAERRLVVKGGTVKQAVEDSQAKFEEYIDKYETGEWKDRWIAPYMVRFLRHNKDCQVTYGNINASVTEGAPVVTDEYSDPLHLLITIVEKSRPKIPVAALENLVSSAAYNIMNIAPGLKLGNK